MEKQSASEQITETDPHLPSGVTIPGRDCARCQEPNDCMFKKRTLRKGETIGRPSGQKYRIAFLRKGLSTFVCPQGETVLWPGTICFMTAFEPARLTALLRSELVLVDFSVRNSFGGRDFFARRKALDGSVRRLPVAPAPEQVRELLEHLPERHVLAHCPRYLRLRLYELMMAIGNFCPEEVKDNLFAAAVGKKLPEINS